MGLVGLPTICRELIRHGMPEETPAALVEKGTLPEHRVLAGTLASLPRQVAEREVGAPTLLIIGKVVALRERLAWYSGGQDHG